MMKTSMAMDNLAPIKSAHSSGILPSFSNGKAQTAGDSFQGMMKSTPENPSAQGFDQAKGESTLSDISKKLAQWIDGQTGEAQAKGSIAQDGRATGFNSPEKSLLELPRDSAVSELSAVLQQSSLSKDVKVSELPILLEHPSFSEDSTISEIAALIDQLKASEDSQISELSELLNQSNLSSDSKVSELSAFIEQLKTSEDSDSSKPSALLDHTKLSGNSKAPEISASLDRSTPLKDAKPSTSPERLKTLGINPDTLGVSGKLSENLSGEDLLNILSDIALKQSKDSMDISAMDIEKIKEAIETGMISLDQLKMIQGSLAKQGVDVSVIDLQKVLTVSGYERSTQGNQVYYTRHEPSSANQPSSSENKPQSTDFMALSREGKTLLVKGTEGMSALPLKSISIHQLNQAINGSQGIESNILRLDGTSTLQKQVAEWSPIVLNKHTADWSKELASALGDRLKMQVNQGVKEATVRLDPPELGRVDFSVKIDGDRVNVQINSSNPQVRELLIQQIDRLRSDLSSGGGGSVDVNVGDGKSEQQLTKQKNIEINDINNVISNDDELELTSENNNGYKTGLDTRA